MVRVPAGSLRGVDLPGPESTAVDSHSAAAFEHIVTLLRSAGCVFAEEEARLLLSEALGPAELARNVQRRVEGLPLEYVLGWAEFAGRRRVVEAGVFVPRRRTELLVNQAVALLSGSSLAVPPVVVDLCCGSGAVGAAILYALPGVELHAADIDATATRCARRNIEPLGGRVHRGDLFEALPCVLRGQIRLLAVNAPYVPTEAIRTMPPEARLYEPAISLDGGEDGLDFHRRVAAGSIEWLAPKGHLLIETSERQAAWTSAILAAAGFRTRTVRSEDLDATVVVGRALPGIDKD
jgi:release factor glutamine methyltransferase